MTIAAIETRYAGHRFRSRLEARWAVVLDSAGLKWEYEPEGFETPCGRYLPDFRVVLLPMRDPKDEEQQIWLEIKPEDYRPEPTDMGRWFSLARGSESMLVVACGLDESTIVITPGHTYCHRGHPGFIQQPALDAGRAARFEFGEQG